MVRVVAMIGKATSRVPVDQDARGRSPRRPSTRRWMASSTRMLLSSSMPKQTVRPLMVMKFTEIPKK